MWWTSLPIWAQITAIVGGFLALLQILQIIGAFIPVANRYRSRIVRYLAEKSNYDKFKKEAIASDIITPLIDMAFEFKQELPKNWIRPPSIEWVKKETKEKFFKDGKIIIQITPREDQDHNFLVAIYYFLRDSLFPITQEIIPVIHKSVALHLTRRIAADRSEELVKKFEDDFLEVAVRQIPQIADYLEKCEILDEGGFLTSIVVREVHQAAKKARFTGLRNTIKAEVNAIIKHNEQFLSQISKGIQIPDDLWSREGPATSYVFLLVARPFHLAIPIYISRARKSLKRGTSRLYVLGAERQKRFAEEVISGIEKSVPGYKLIEKFYLNKDYRGERGGVGALFVKVE